jgi:hypothetical protein
MALDATRRDRLRTAGALVALAASAVTLAASAVQAWSAGDARLVTRVGLAGGAVGLIAAAVLLVKQRRRARGAAPGPAR